MTGEAGEHPFARLVGERGGVALDAGAGALEAPLDGAAFVAILARGDDILPPVARLDPLLAGAWLVLAAGPAAGPRQAAAASALAARVGGEGPPAYLVSAGRTTDAGQVDKVDRIRRQWEAFFFQATDGRMRVDTRLR